MKHERAHTAGDRLVNRQPDWLTTMQQELAVEVLEQSRVGGGDFAEAFRVCCDDQRRFFVKTHRQPPPGFFSTEAAGLSWLRAPAMLAVPEVVLVCDEPPMLVLEWIELGQPNRNTEPALGRGLARLHQTGHPCFGRSDERHTGSLALPNNAADSWEEFYAERRLLPLIDIARQRQSLPESVLKNLETVVSRLHLLEVPQEPPAMLHGDLWAGNRVVDSNGVSWLIDPAAHGGHREFDLAMMRLFGGFSDACFSAYQEEFPLAGGWQERVALHQLAPLIVHAIKFGGSYVAATEQAVALYQ